MSLTRGILSIATGLVGFVVLVAWNGLVFRAFPESNPPLVFLGALLIGIWAGRSIMGLWRTQPEPAQQPYSVMDELPYRLSRELLARNGDAMANNDRYSSMDVVGARYPHKHHLTKMRILTYLNDKETGGFVSPRCDYCIGREVKQTPKWTHEQMIQIAAENNLGFDQVITIEKVVDKFVNRIVEVPVERIVEVPFSQTLSFGETASLTASLQHGQHLLNDDLRLAMLNNDTELVAITQARLADHLTLMDKLGVEKAEWTDNEKALRKAGRLELPIEDSIWSRA